MEQPGLTQFMLILHSLPQLGEKSLIRVLSLMRQRMISSEAVISYSVQDWVDRCEMPLPAAEFLVLNRENLLMKSKREMLDIGKLPLHVLNSESITYPHRLQKNAEIPPPILYCAGSVSLLADSKDNDRTFTFTIAVSNGASAEILSRQDHIAENLISQGGVVVTGHDRQAYQRLALSAQRMNSPVIYILDRGLLETLGPNYDRIPFAAARIRESRLNVDRDAVLSSFRLSDHGLGANNRRRDALIFALSDKIIALDVRDGGSMAAECMRAHKQREAVEVCEGGREGNVRLLSARCPVFKGINR